jgi:outer membrane protein assembly factor BamD
MVKNVCMVMALLLAALWCACGHSPDKADVPPPPEELYRAALALYIDKSWRYAYEDFERCRARYPLSEWGIKAELKMADCRYFMGEYAVALAQYEEFSRLHPAHEFIDYVHYQIGMCHYRQVCSLDRDQSFSENAIKQFERLTALFPNSPYVPDALVKINECHELIAAHWVYVGDFYYRTGCYASALDRYREALQDHFPYLEEPGHVFYQLGKTYLRLEKPDQARQQFVRVLREYPGSAYASKAQTLLENVEEIEELDGLTFDDVVDGLNPFYECESPLDDDETCEPKE